MADITYMTAIGFDVNGDVVRQVTTPVDADSDLEQERGNLVDIMVYKSEHAICDIKVAVMESTGYDGKDKYRVHQLVHVDDS